MSTILDSLRKSSNNRGDNSKNSIDNFSFSGNSTMRKSKFSAMLILLLITVALFYFGYQYLYNGEKSYVDSGNLTVVEKAKDVDSFAQHNDLAVIEPAIEIQKQDRPNSKDVKQRIKELQEQRKQKLASSVRSKPVKLESNVVSTEKNLDEVSKKDSKNNKKTENINTPTKPELKLAVPGDIGKQQPITKAKQEFPYVYELPFSLRKDIPNFKLNIHVYDNDPESRIAIINGVRFVIDDMIDETVLLKDIIPEGVLLEFHNQVFLIPK